MVFIPAYIFVLAALILVDYTAGIAIETARGTRRRYALYLSIVANVGMLAAFKYFNFGSQLVAALLHHIGIGVSPIHLSWALPLGLSFHTFQSLSYTIEVYRGNVKAERHLGIYALYVMFFPQLVAGPIERPKNLLPQFHAVQTFDFARAASGLRLMAWGFFQKLVIADRLATFVDPAYSAPANFNGTSLAIATVFFGFQIYCDFSGYSTIAIGTARVLGFDLMRNFDAPYLSSSVGNFWRRWHISLSSWFRDYVYYPLGGNRVNAWRNARNILIVFLLSGLWHGANWTFVVWGALHGTLMIIDRLGRRWLHASSVFLMRLGRWAGGAATFVCVNFLWIFFRAGSLSDATMIAKRVVRFPSELKSLSIGAASDALGMPRQEFMFSLVFISLLLAVDATRRRFQIGAWLDARPAPTRWTIYYAAMGLFFIFARFHSRDFIYFQF